MNRLLTIISILLLTTGLQAQETPNAKQARRLFDKVWNMVYGQQGSRLHYAVNIIGIYKTEGTIWTKGKKSKSIDPKYISWNDDKNFYRLDRKLKTVTIWDAHDDERDKLAAKFKFEPDNYTYSIKEADKRGYLITMHAKRGAKGIKEVRLLLEKKTLAPISLRIKVAFFHTTIKISQFKHGGISDDLFTFPREEYSDYTFVDKR